MPDEPDSKPPAPAPPKPDQEDAPPKPDQDAPPKPDLGAPLKMGADPLLEGKVGVEVRN